jgi:hypothetical protein
MASELSKLGEAAGATEPLRSSLRSLQGLADGFGRAMTTAFKRSVVDGRQLGDVLRSLARDLSGRALNAALAPIGKGIGGLISGLLGGVTPLAAGGGIAAPRSLSPASGAGRTGAGVMGASARNAGRALARGLGGGLGLHPEHGLIPPVGGSLGVRAGQGGPNRQAAPDRNVSVTFNVQARDAESFRRAEAELTAMLARAVARGQRGL